MEKKLKDQIAIVTGASSGIGAGCAKELAKAGANLDKLFCYRGKGNG